MICVAGHMPVLKVGDHQVCGYDTRWIKQGLELAAKHAGQDDYDFLEEIYHAIKRYLEWDCDLEVLDVKLLNNRIAKMLNQVGLKALSEGLPFLCPPVNISLEIIVRKSGEGFELGFFEELRREIYRAKEAGVGQLVLEDLRMAVLLLTGKKKLDKASQGFMNEVQEFVKSLSYSQDTFSGAKRIVVPIEKKCFYKN